MTTRFTDSTPGSASQVAQAFSELRTQGQASIDSLVVLRENTLLLFNNALAGLNGKRVRANRMQEIGVAVKFVTSDLQDINQPITTASVRCDSNNVALRERAAPGEAIVNSVRFSASQGTIQALNTPTLSSSGNLGALYRVATQNGAIPIGTFDIQLLNQVSTSLVIFDMMDTPSNAVVQAFTSQNGINFTEALSITRNGYRLAAWFTSQEIKFIRITVTPALPDVLGGSVFTFGLTDLHAFSVQYHLRSDVYTNQIVFTPRSASVQFSTLSVPGLHYFLSLAGNPFIEVFPGTLVPIPGVTTHTTTVGLTDPTGKINLILPGNVYLSTLSIKDHATQLEVRTAPGLSNAASPPTNKYITVDGSGNMYLVLYNHAADQFRTFDISYLTGPSTVTASMQVELVTDDLNTTPVYAGAKLIEV